MGSVSSYRAAPLAVVGFGGRVSGCADLDELWSLLRAGADAFTAMPAGRRRLTGWPDGQPDRAGYIDGVDEFDAAFFGISPREAEVMDPQQRLMLEVVWRLLEDSGIRPADLRGPRTGVWMAGLWHDYEILRVRAGAAATQHSIVGNSLDILSARLSYLLGAGGPSLTIESSCSSSLVALHLAAQSLARGEVDVAVVGASNLVLTPQTSDGLALFGGLSPTGQCRPFGAGADGFVRGEGVLAVALKRLDDAEAAGNPVAATVIATGMNNDGGGDSLVTPNGAAQAELLREVYEVAGISPAEVAYLEAHGTGTRRGDPTEAAAIGAVLGRPGGVPLPIGSVKANIGHLEPAAGLAGLVKLLLAIRNGELPPSRNAEVLNPDIDFDHLGVEVLRSSRSLADLPGHYLGVNSFGWGGTNAHVVLGHPPVPAADAPAEPDPAAEPVEVLRISARTKAGLSELVARTADVFDADPDGLARSWAWHREPMAERLAVVGATSGADLRQLWSEQLPAGVLEQGPVAVVRDRARPVGRVAWVFPGQGAQWAGMAADLYGRNHAFSARLDECAEALRPLLDLDLVPALCDPARVDWLARVDLVQPALWAMSVSLAAAWQAAGVVPDVLIGHSQGEIAAATVAGLLSVPDGAAVVARRSRLLTRLAGRGRMLAVDLDADSAAAKLDGFEELVSIAVLNGPRSTVLSGDAEAVLLLASILEAEDIFCRLIEVDYASHSPQVDEIAPDVMAALAAIEPRPARLPMLSTVDLSELAGPEVDAGYWARNLRQPVRFAEAVERVIQGGVTHVIEVSPHPGLGVPIAQQAERLETGVTVLPTLRRDGGPRRFDLSVAQAWAAGLPADGPRPDRRAPRSVRAPRYPWHRARFWLDPDALGHSGPVGPVQRTRTAVPGVDEARLTLDRRALSWLGDHRVGDAVVLPAAVSLATALTLLPAGAGLREVHFPEPLVLDDQDREVTVRIRESADGHEVFRISSELSGAADGELSRGLGQHLSAIAVPSVEPVAPAPAAPSGGLESSGADFYADCAARGLHYGETFRQVTSVHRDGDRAVVRLAAAGPVPAFPTALHPVRWDAILQAGLALTASADEVIPVEIAEVAVRRPIGTGPLTVFAERVSGRIALTVADEDGVLAELRGVRFRSLTGSGMAAELWTTRWQPGAETGGAGAEPNTVTCALPGAEPVATALTDPAELARVDADRVVLLATGTDPAGLEAGLLGLTTALVALAGRDRTLLVDVVTRGGFDPERPEPVARAIHGLVAVAQTEYSQLTLRVVSLDHAVGGLPSLAGIARSEDLIAVRADRVEVGRLEAGVLNAGPAALVSDPPQPFRIAARRTGQLSSLGARYEPARPPGPGEVQVRIEAAGLNFIDVLKALGTYPDPADPDPTRLGLEAAGTVSAVGAGVDRLRVGDPVVVCGPGGLASHRTLDHRLVVPVPAHLSMSQAAAMPMAYLTAWYSLVDLAGIGPGQCVLVHSATGGVGLAALSVARLHGAEVIGSAGTPAKRARLAELGVGLVLDSRSPDWAAELRRARPAGVDIVLNSLPGRGLTHGLEVLAPGGRFIELGKRDIDQGSALPLELFATGKSFATVDLTGLLRTRPDRFHRLLEDTWSAIVDGRLPALPIQEHPFAEAGPAFAELAAGRHTGKVVLTEPGSVAAVDARPVPDRFDGGLVITGGLGALGRSLTNWLVEQGARRIALLGRSAPAADAEADLTRWRAAGADVHTYAVDVADRDALAGVLADFRRSGPLTGVFHAAGVLADATLDTLDQTGLAAVLAPKVTGARWLDGLTGSDPLEWFVLFSSAASFVGSPGQGSYAAANGYLDGLALRRRAAGRPGLSVQWGPVAGTGLAAGTARGDRLAERGLAGIQVEECWPVLGRLSTADAVLACFARLDPSRWVESYPAVAARASWQPLLSGARNGPVATTALSGLEGAELRDRIRAEVRTSAARILQMAEPDLADDQPLKAQGLDSLMSLELRSALERVTGRSLSPTLLWKYTTVTEVTTALAGLIEGARRQPADAPGRPDDDWEPLLADRNGSHA